MAANGEVIVKYDVNTGEAKLFGPGGIMSIYTTQDDAESIARVLGVTCKVTPLP